MSELDDIVTYTFHWRAQPDACPICAALHGQIISGQDLFATILWSNQGKPIWNLDVDQSLAHGYERFNCRCTLEVNANVDMSKAGWFLEFHDIVEETVMRYDQPVTVYRSRETGRFVRGPENA